MTTNRKKGILLLCTILFVWIIAPVMVLAEQSTEPLDANELDLPAQFSKSTIGESFYAFMKVMLILLFVIGLMILLIRFLANKNRAFMSNRSIKNLSGVPLGQNKSLQIIEIGTSLYIVGVGENVQLIEKIDQPEEIEFIKQSIHTQHSSSMKWNAWSEWTSGLRTKMKMKNISEIEEDPVTFQEVFNEKMQQVSVRRKKIEQLINDENNKDRSRDQ